MTTRKPWNPADNLALPIETAKPTEWDVVGLFVGTDAEIAARFAVMAACQRHRFRSLTDRLVWARKWFDSYQSGADCCPTSQHVWEDASLFLGLDHPAHEHINTHWSMETPWPLPNLMVGTTIRTQADADERLAKLADVPARFRHVRVEPAEEIDLFGIGDNCSRCGPDGCDFCPGYEFLDLVEIAGGSGPEQLRLVQAIGAQVLDARRSEHDFWTATGERITRTSGPALSIVANDPDSTVHGSHPYVEIAGRRQRWNQQPVGWRPTTGDDR